MPRSKGGGRSSTSRGNRGLNSLPASDCAIDSPVDGLGDGMAGIAWRRGFFRIWLVLAILWVAFALLVQGSNVFNPYVPGKIVATPAGGTVQTWDRYGEQQRNFDEGVAAGALQTTQIGSDSFLLYTRKDIEPARLEERVAEAQRIVDDYVANETTRRRSSSILPLLCLAFIPPFIVFVLGAAIAWALSGFRRAA